MPKCQRSIGSLRQELVMKAWEAVLTAIRIFKHPQVNFKSEMFITLMMIAWTHLLMHPFERRRSNIGTTSRGQSRPRCPSRISAASFRINGSRWLAPMARRHLMHTPSVDFLPLPPVIARIPAAQANSSLMQRAHLFILLRWHMSLPQTMVAPEQSLG